MSKEIRDLMLALLEARRVDATICPSEVARAITNTGGYEHAANGWRRAMPAVHTTVDELVTEGKVQLSWKGKKLATRAGPYRIGRNTDGA